MNYAGFGAGLPAFSPFIGAQAGANDLAIAPGAAVYPAAKATATIVTKNPLRDSVATVWVRHGARKPVRSIGQVRPAFCA